MEDKLAEAFQLGFEKGENMSKLTDAFVEGMQEQFTKEALPTPSKSQLLTALGGLGIGGTAGAAGGYSYGSDVADEREEQLSEEGVQRGQAVAQQLLRQITRMDKNEGKPVANDIYYDFVDYLPANNQSDKSLEDFAGPIDRESPLPTPEPVDDKDEEEKEAQLGPIADFVGQTGDILGDPNTWKSLGVAFGSGAGIMGAQSRRLRNMARDFWKRQGFDVSENLGSFGDSNIWKYE